MQTLAKAQKVLLFLPTAAIWETLSTLMNPCLIRWTLADVAGFLVKGFLLLLFFVLFCHLATEHPC